MDSPPAKDGLQLSWKNNTLDISGTGLPVPRIQVTYLEAFCRNGSHDRDWEETVIRHTTGLLSRQADARQLRLESRLADGVVIAHQITATSDQVDFRLSAYNPTAHPSAAHWAQSCIRVGEFTGCKNGSDQSAYLRKSFVFLANELVRMPTPRWATLARYTPGQVWCPPMVPRTDVNPRPLNPLIPSNGLIGCFSQDESWILATAWEPYQELFQGICQCLHSDFRIGGLKPRERKAIRGKIYILRGSVELLLDRYRKDFPEHETAGTGNA